MHTLANDLHIHCHWWFTLH